MKTAKQLAGELGLIRKRTFNQTSLGKNNGKSLGQQFSYLIVIDFESTCWRDKRNSDQEIIEFPAVLINTSTGKIESEYHTYCLPEENPTLSEFCTELTGITQEKVESGIPLFLCLKKFSRWLQKLEAEKNIAYNSSSDKEKQLCTFVTWSDWDLGICLHHESRRKQLIRPDALRCWIDLRATYRKFYQRIPKGLEGALKDLGIKFEGRQHSGLDDARNTAHLAWRMIRDGCLMKITKNGLLPSSKGDGEKAKKVTNMDKQCPLEHGSNSRSSLSSDYTKSDCGMRTPENKVPPTDAAMNIQQFKAVDFKDATDKKTQMEESWPLNKEQDNVNAQSDGVKNLTESSLHQFTKRSKNLGIKTVNASCTAAFTTPDVPFKRTQFVQFQRTLSKCSPALTNQERGTRVVNIKTHADGSDNSTFKTPEVKGHQGSRQGMTRSSSSTRTNKHTPNLRNCKSASTTPTSIYGAENEMGKAAYTKGVSPSTFQTPLIRSKDIQFARITPPLCNCGRRTRRKTVFSPGPNQGRPYYSCCGRRQSGRFGLRDVTNYQGGCNFFKWESLIIKDLKTAKSSVGSTFIKPEGSYSV